MTNASTSTALRQTTRQGRLPSACDLCHYRKTRCDRKDLCGNCSAAGVQCLRQRPRHVSQHNNKAEDDRISIVLDCMSRLEESLRRSTQTDVKVVQQQDKGAPQTTHENSSSLANSAENDPNQREQPNNDNIQPQPPPPTPTPPVPTPPMHRWLSEEKTTQELPAKRKAQSPLTSPPLSKSRQLSIIPSDSDISEESLIDLHRYLGSSLHVDYEIDSERRHTLDSAISLAKEIALSDATHRETVKDADQYTDFYDRDMYPALEFLSLIFTDLRCASGNDFIKFNANASTNGLERMALGLRNGTIHGQTRIQYLICVNYFAYCYLIGIGATGQSPEMRQYQKRMKNRYRDNVLAALKSLDTSIRADLSLLRALISGAMLMQDIGNMKGCWRLNSVACKICAMFTGRDLGSAIPPDEAHEIQLIFIKCYIFDRGLASNIEQPPSLEDFELNQSVLETDNPGHTLLSILLEFAGVQDSMARCKTVPYKNSVDQVKQGYEDMGSLREEMRRIRARIDEFRAQSPFSEDGSLTFEWQSIDFNFHSMMTSIIRLSSRSDDCQAYIECLSHARTALSTLKCMLEFASSPNSCSERCVSSLAWALPLFLLRPLFFIFRNLVITSDPVDLKRLQDISKGLGLLEKNHHSMTMFSRLSKSFIKLYTESPSGARKLSPNSSKQLLQSGHGTHQHDFSMNHRSADHFQVDRQDLAAGRYMEGVTDFSSDVQVQGVGVFMPDAAILDQDFDWNHISLGADLNWLDKDFFSR